MKIFKFCQDTETRKNSSQNIYKQKKNIYICINLSFGKCNKKKTKKKQKTKKEFINCIFTIKRETNCITMTVQILLRVFVVVVLAAFHLSAIKVQTHCFYRRGCYICKNRQSNIDNCLLYRYCFYRGNSLENPECIKYNEGQKRE